MIKIIDIVEKHNTLITIHGAEGGPTGDRGGDYVLGTSRHTFFNAGVIRPMV